ncbi:cytochrome c3 family protein [Pseudodesulfovibrio indicus]|uniref:cytochrome c3 family protein n=1 Tax=Pseudodesulfovibrio indicus TaxID=1716143 RepID=UPI002930275F|nr:cytochrome c3 family protein [Pseudodesulfovibrio indicus]
MYRFMTITLSLCALLFGASLAVAAPEVPGDLRLVPPETIKATKAPVDFSHARHGAAQVDCVTCHHTWDGASAVQSCATPGCHDQPGKKGANAFYTAFHSKGADNSCLSCHKSLKKEGKAVPVGCSQCHAK